MRILGGFVAALAGSVVFVVSVSAAAEVESDDYTNNPCVYASCLVEEIGVLAELDVTWAKYWPQGQYTGN